MQILRAAGPATVQAGAGGRYTFTARPDGVAVAEVYIPADAAWFLGQSGYYRVDTVGIDQTTPGITDKVTAVGAQVVVTTVTISNGQSLSPAIDLGTARLARIGMPASWTTANLTFQSSTDNVTYRDLYDAYGNEYTVQAAAGRSILINLADFLSIRYLKIRSGTSGTSVNQSADRVLTLTLVP
jgi:hypothetical protein